MLLCACCLVFVVSCGVSCCGVFVCCFVGVLVVCSLCGVCCVVGAGWSLLVVCCLCVV